MGRGSETEREGDRGKWRCIYRNDGVLGLFFCTLFRLNWAMIHISNEGEMRKMEMGMGNGRRGSVEIERGRLYRTK